ncbi:MAG TPA: riboflavin synthase [Verrucomicrobia bacterium]|nr:riboflavin synthase [Verrucomicrobiota bacterium]
MFTGLIEAVGSLRAMSRHAGGATLMVGCPPWSPELVAGESIAVQGACLTVVDFEATQFRADVLDETLRRTNLGQKQPGQCLNLERALRFGDRLGGHLVSGHVDTVGSLASIRMDGRDRVLNIRSDRETLLGIVRKGSVALDGISLTVSAVTDEAFDVCIIPWTWEHTSLHERRPGDPINIETDLIGKYIQRHLTAQPSGGLSEATLAAAGFY